MNEPSNRIIFGAMRHEPYYDLLLFFISANSSYQRAPPNHVWFIFQCQQRFLTLIVVS